MGVSEVADRVSVQMAARERDGDVIQTPGGLYYPVCFLGRDGYVVFNDNHISTILPEEYCPEINNIRRK
jgi:hypothetical protein